MPPRRYRNPWQKMNVIAIFQNTSSFLKTAARIAIGMALPLVVLAGCEQTVIIRGAVTDVQGDRLPGVAVTVQGSDAQTLTDPRGLYSLRCAPGALSLQYLKTDYTPGRLDLETGGLRTVEAPAVKLWPLPDAKGIYFFEKGRYQATSRTTPKRFSAKDLGNVLGTRINVETETLNTQPLIISYKLPSYDIRINRLKQVEAAPQTEGAPPAKTASADTKETTPAEQIWVSGETISVITEPIDEPDRLLVELRLAAPLTPGTYAVQWGAFEGHASTNPNVYLFRIVEPAPPENAAEEAAPEQNAPPKEEAPKKPEKQKTEKPKAPEETPVPPSEDSGY